MAVWKCLQSMSGSTLRAGILSANRDIVGETEGISQHAGIVEDDALDPVVGTSGVTGSATMKHEVSASARVEALP